MRYLRLKGRCSIRLSYGRLTYTTEIKKNTISAFKKNGRGREIRTPDILLPKQARYQTALCPDRLILLGENRDFTRQLK
jgi:hypothetical protein